MAGIPVLGRGIVHTGSSDAPAVFDHLFADRVQFHGSEFGSWRQAEQGLQCPHGQTDPTHVGGLRPIIGLAIVLQGMAVNVGQNQLGNRGAGAVGSEAATMGKPWYANLRSAKDLF